MVSRGPKAIDEECFHVGLELAQDRVFFLQLLPGLQGQKRFGAAGGAWVDGDDPLRACAAEEEGQVDREVQFLPLRIGQAKAGQEFDIPGHAAVASVELAAEEDGTSGARTDKSPSGWLDQVFVDGRKRCCTARNIRLRGAFA